MSVLYKFIRGWGHIHKDHFHMRYIDWITIQIYVYCIPMFTISASSQMPLRQEQFFCARTTTNEGIDHGAIDNTKYIE